MWHREGASNQMILDAIQSLVAPVVTTVTGGMILAALLFLIKERLSPLPYVIGRWHFEMQTENTAYRPYEGMVLRYVAMLWREGHVVHGTVEKTYEKSSTVEKEYVGKKRTRGEVRGHIEKYYLGKDRLFLHIVEDGHGRKSTHFHELTSKSSDCMTGRFTSMVADQDGTVEWQRVS